MRVYSLGLLAVLSGCAGLAVQPPTPAKNVDVRSLAPTSDRYYLILFSSEKSLKQPRYSHTWATAVRIADDSRIEHHTISWMPATLEIEPLRFRVEPGVNLPLHKTITDVALANQEQMEMWGPYEVRPSLFARFLVQKQFMDSGRMQYQCVDSAGEAARTGNGCNCIHAITDMDPEHGRRQYPLTRYGFAAGLDIARRIRELNLIVEPTRTHDFLIPALGLHAYPIVRANADDIFMPSRAPLIGIR